jgi:ATP-dependent DNA ligase
VVVQREGKRVRLFTRNGHDWTNRYPLIVGTGQYRIFVEPAA